MSTIMQDRPRPAPLKPLHCRPLRPLQGRRQAGTVSRSHLLMSAVVAVVGTGIFAAVDQSYGRSAPAPKASEADIRAAPVAAVAVANERRPDKMSENLSSSPPGPAPLVPSPIGDVPDTRSEALPAIQSAALTVPAAAERDPVVAERAAVTGSLARLRSVAPPGSAAIPAGRPQTAQASSPMPGDCPAPALRAVLADVSARFGAVAVVASHQGRPNNHTAGSFREKLHHDCKAIDFRPDRSRIDEIKAYLRSRPEIAGVESYRDGVIHMDAAATNVSPGARKPTAVAQTEERTTPADR